MPAEKAPVVKAAEVAKPEPTLAPPKVEEKKPEAPKVEPKKPAEPVKSVEPAPKPASAPVPAPAPAPIPGPTVIVEDEDRVQESCMSRALGCLLGKKTYHTPQAQQAR